MTAPVYMAPLLTDAIRTNQPLAFAKFGDGEIICVYGTLTRLLQLPCQAPALPPVGRMNCDHDNYYVVEKALGLVHAIRHFTNDSSSSFCGLWDNSQKHAPFWQQFMKTPIRWANYHSIIIEKEDLVQQNQVLKDKIELYRTIQQSDRPKVMICNKLLAKAESLLNIDYMHYVPTSNWFDHLSSYVAIITEYLKKQGSDYPIVLTMAGMGAKVLLYKLMEAFPKGVFIDIGSGLDILCTKRRSRDNGTYYEDMRAAFAPILPMTWDDEKYEALYKEAEQIIGITPYGPITQA
jgi:hypothetical protein